MFALFPNMALQYGYSAVSVYEMRGNFFYNLRNMVGNYLTTFRNWYPMEQHNSIRKWWRR
jgi:hypothetical protein